MSDFPWAQAVDLDMYADNTALYTSCRSHDIVRRLLQGVVDDAIEWATRWRLRMNEDKCVALRFTRRISRPNDAPSPE